MKKLVFTLILLITCVILPRSVRAESSLSEAGRIKYFKINEKYALQVLPARKGEKDSILIVEYEKNSNLKSFYQRVCIAQFMVKDQILRLETPIYYDKGIFFSDTQFFDATVGSVFDKEVYGEFGTANIAEKIKQLGLQKNSNNELSYSFIKKNFSNVDIDKTGDLGCFMVPFLVLFVGLPVGFLIIIGVVIIKYFLSKKNG